MINRTIFTHKIAILAVQETHLTAQMAESITTCFGKNLEIYSWNPSRITSKCRSSLHYK